MNFKPTRKDIKRARAYRLGFHGIRYPVRTVIASRLSGLPLSYACALLGQESDGGKNIFGHDPVQSIKSPPGKNTRVTLPRYLYYKARRKKGLGMQGVGPCQLTWWATQDLADSLGGCWRPVVNMYVGFKQLSDNIKAHGLRDGCRAYNGSGPAADRYAGEMMLRIQHWQVIFAEERKRAK